MAPCLLRKKAVYGFLVFKFQFKVDNAEGISNLWQICMRCQRYWQRLYNFIEWYWLLKTNTKLISYFARGLPMQEYPLCLLPEGIG
jgi:hypothetical protein